MDLIAVLDIRVPAKADALCVNKKQSSKPYARNGVKSKLWGITHRVNVFKMMKEMVKR